jgi:hypothetical protein
VKYIKIVAFCYVACPLQANGRKCKKNFEESTNNMWYYPKCQKIMPDCDFRYFFQLKMENHIGEIWTATFDEVVTSLFHISAKYLYMSQYGPSTTTMTPQTFINHVIYTSFFH